MKSALFLASLMSTPWAMQSEVLTAYAKTIARQYGDKFAADGGSERPIQGRMIAAAPRPTNANRSRGSIAVLPLYGVIMPRAGMLEMCGGGTSIERFTQAFRAAIADETVHQVLIDIDSPGGSVYGVGELAAEIRTARATKPVFGVANSVAASAAYWIGAACSELYVTPGGQVGSIGVITAHEDISKSLQMAGVKVTLLTAGKYKAEGNPYGPLDAEACASIQSDINSYYADFTNAVARGRGVSVEAVRKNMGQGRMLRSDAARTAEMINGVATFDEVVKRMQGTVRGATPAPQRQPEGRSALRAALNELALLDDAPAQKRNSLAAIRRELQLLELE